MSFWIAVVIIVLILEAVRIGLSSYLLLHILRGIEREETGPDIGYRPVDWYRERDRLASTAMAEVRQSLDSLSQPVNIVSTASTVEALNAYILHHQQRPDA